MSFVIAVYAGSSCVDTFDTQFCSIESATDWCKEKSTSKLSFMLLL